MSAIIHDTEHRFLGSLLRKFSPAAIKGTGGTAALRIAGAGLGFVSHIVYARLLGGGEYGIFAYYWVWVVVLGTFSQLGLVTANTRFVAQYLERRRLPRLRILLTFGTYVPLLAGATMGLLFFIFDQYSNSWTMRHGAQAAIVAALCVPLFAFGESLRGYARGFGHIVLAYKPAYLDRPLLALFFAGCFYLLRGTIDVTILLLAYLAALTVSIARQYWRISADPSLTTSRRRLPLGRRHAAGWLMTALPLIIVDGYFIMAANMDVIILKYHVQPETLAAYFAATKIAAVANFLPAAAGAQAAPMLARLWERGERDKLARTSRMFAFLAAGPAFLAVVGMIPFGDDFLRIFGQGFDSAQVAMLIIVAGIFVSALAGPVRYLLAMTGQERPMANVMIGATVFNLFMNLVLIPSYGMIGAALATALSTVGYALALALLVKSRLGFWPGVGAMR